VLGLGIAAAAFVGKQAVQQYVAFMARPAGLRSFYKGGFQQTMDRREASLILGLRESAGEEKIKDAHRRIMIANHPDSGMPEFGCALALGGGTQSCRMLFRCVSIPLNQPPTHPCASSNTHHHPTVHHAQAAAATSQPRSTKPRTSCWGRRRRGARCFEAAGLGFVFVLWRGWLCGCLLCA